MNINSMKQIIKPIFASVRYYKNSSVIVDLAMGYIPRSTERIL